MSSYVKKKTKTKQSRLLLTQHILEGVSLQPLDFNHYPLCVSSKGQGPRCRERDRGKNEKLDWAYTARYKQHFILSVKTHLHLFDTFAQL